MNKLFLIILCFMFGACNNIPIDPARTDLKIEYSDGSRIVLSNPKDIKIESLTRNKETGNFELKGYESSTNIHAAQT